MHTVHTMKSLFGETIYIAPVGFEIDRIVMPAITSKADVVYLIVHENKSEDKALKYVDEVQSQLEKKKIKVVIKPVDRLRVFSIIRTVKEIIDENKNAKFIVNVASGSKIHAIALMMACMVHQDKEKILPIYPKPKKYQIEEFKSIKEQQTYGVDEILKLPTYNLPIPSRDLLTALKIIKEYQSSHKNGITKKELSEKTAVEGIISTSAKDETRAQMASLDKKIIKPLFQRWHFIEEKKIGKNRHITLSKEGEYASEFLF